jgi:NAD(P)-dependent dehydrogenase (short-subunit alcohol dehydrogenase family)
LVTGANKGLGKETAKQLAAMGCTVFVGGRKLADVTTAAADAGGKAEPLQLDINDSASIQAAVQKVTKDHGCLDILVNNAGACFDAKGDFTATNCETVTRDELVNSFDLNLFRQIEVIQSFLPLLKAAPYANVVNIGSVVGSNTAQGLPDGGVGKVLAYASSKAAFHMTTVVFASSLKDSTKIRFNAAHPGWLKTESGGGDTGSPYQMEVPHGARTPVYLASLSAESDVNGALVGPSDVTATNGVAVAW